MQSSWKINYSRKDYNWYEKIYNQEIIPLELLSGICQGTMCNHATNDFFANYFSREKGLEKFGASALKSKE